jgi:hypothetical protein
MNANFIINLSDKKGSEYFENLKNNPSKYFRDIRVQIIRKEINAVIQFNKEIILMNAAKNETLKVNVSQRRGYKVIEFYC